MQEHARKKWKKGSAQVSVAGKESGEPRGNHGVAQFKEPLRVRGDGEFVEEDGNVSQDERDVDDGGVPGWIEVFERDEHER